jgi:hypothetical protein
MIDFSNPGHVKRILRRLGQGSFKNQSSPTERAAFLRFATSFPAVYASNLPIGGAGTDFDWEWWKYPAGILDKKPGKGFWAVPKQVLDPELENEANFKGWWFEPLSISVVSMTSVFVEKAVRLSRILNTAYITDLTQETEPFLPLIAGNLSSSTAATRHIFSRGSTFQVGNNVAINTLLECLLLPFKKLVFPDLIGFLATDRMSIAMVGKWHFEPRFLSSQEVADR